MGYIEDHLEILSHGQGTDIEEIEMKERAIQIANQEEGFDAYKEAANPHRRLEEIWEASLKFT